MQNNELTDAIFNQAKDLPSSSSNHRIFSNSGYFPRSQHVRIPRQNNRGYDRIPAAAQSQPSPHDIPSSPTLPHSVESTWTSKQRHAKITLSKWAKTRNWDTFYLHMYEYYLGHGFTSIVLARTFNLLTLLFVVCFSTFLISCIDHANISKKTSLSDAIIDGCPHLGLFHVLSLIIFAIFWLWELVKYVFSIPALRDMQEFYNSALDIPDSELSHTPWASILEKVEQLHASIFTASHLKHVTSLDMVGRIMRKENYLIALFNKDILNLKLPLPPWLPVLGGQKSLLTKVLEWNIEICIMKFVFGETDQGNEIGVRQVFLKDVPRSRLISELRKRFVLMAILNLLLAPFTLVFLSIYFLFKYGEEYHKNPTQLGSRSFTPLAKWKFRDFNELPHVFQARLNAAFEPSSKYLAQFPQEGPTAIVAKFVSYVAGSIALALTLLSLIDDDILLKFEITPGRSTLYYLGLFGIIWSAARAFVPDPHVVYEPEIHLKEVVSQTHYFPIQWKRYGLSSHVIGKEFSQLFDFRILNFVYELTSIAFAPFILYFNLPDNAANIVDFFKQFTVHVDGIGHVCTYSMFDFRQFNEIRGLRRDHETEADDKMAQSMVYFKKTYKKWEPSNQQSSQMLHSLMKKDMLVSPLRRHPSQEEDLNEHIPRSPSNTSNAEFIDRILQEEKKIDARLNQQDLSGFVPPPNLPLSDRESDDDVHELETQRDINFVGEDDSDNDEKDPLGIKKF